MRNKDAKIGTKVQVHTCSGIDSDKIGYIVDPRHYLHKVEDSYARSLVTERGWKLVAITGHLDPSQGPTFEASVYYYTVLPYNRLFERKEA